MKVNKDTELFEDLSRSEAQGLMRLADRLHDRMGVPLDHPTLEMWFGTVGAGNSLIARQVISKEHLPFMMMKSAALFFQQGSRDD